MDSIDWTEIQTVICVAKQGSLSAAARLLGVNHSTILRRIQLFEQKHHVNVFVRETKGYRLSRHGRALLQDFEQIDQIMLGLQRRIVDYDSELVGRLVITSTENIFASYLQKPLGAFAKQFPSVELDLLISNQIVDMNQLEADIAIRPISSLPSGFFGANLFEIQFKFYATPELCEVLSDQPIEDCPSWIGYSGFLAQARVGQLLRQRMVLKPLLTANSFDSVAAMANEGLGLALLPSFIGDDKASLQAISEEVVFSTSVFAMAPNDLKVSRRVNALLNFLNGHFHQKQ